MKIHKLFLCALAFLPSLCNAQITRSFTEPVEERHVAANQPDVVTRLSVREGALVQSGDVIAELDNSVLRKKLAIAKLRSSSVAAISGARVVFDSNKKKVEKLRSMLEKGHANPSEIEKAQADLETSQAELELAQEKKSEFELEVERIEAEIEQNIIRSPISGLVTEIYCKPGEFISSQDRKLATVVCIERLKARFYLHEKWTSQLRAGLPVSLKIGAGSSSIQGKIEYVSPVVDPESGTSRVDVVIDNHDHKLSSGTVCYWNGLSQEYGSTQNEKGLKQ